MLKMKIFRQLLISFIILFIHTTNSFIYSQGLADNSLRITGNGKSETTSSERYVCRVNVGGESLVDSQGNEWQADHIYRAGGYGYLGVGGTYETANPISGTENQKIYQSERYQLFGYRFEVPNGHYEIILHFAEIYHQKKGNRLINIEIEDTPVEQNLDIVEHVGPNAALRLVYNTKELGIPIRDNRIDIKFKNIKDDTKLSGIEVIQLLEQPTLLQFKPEKLEFGTTQNELDFEIQNIGAKQVNWSVEQNSLPNWIRIQSLSSGVLQANQSAVVKVNISRGMLKGGINNDEITIAASDVKMKVPVSVAVAGAAGLLIQTNILDFENDKRYLTLQFSNNGGNPLDWSIDRAGLPSWISRVYPNRGRLEMGQSIFVNVTANREKLNEGSHQASLPIRHQGGSENALLKISVPENKSRIIFVDASARGRNSGQSWQDAFVKIKDAIQAAGVVGSNGRVEIWVAEGIYYEQNILVKSGIEFYGGFQGDESVREERNDVWAHPTIVDGGKRGRCFECQHRTVIDGFVIQNGRDWSSGEGKGAAILAYENDVTIRNNLIRNNVVSWAGAVFIEGDEPSKRVPGHSPLIEYNVLTGNFSNYCAAAIEMRASAATVRNNTIVKNNGYGLEINTVLNHVKDLIYGEFYNNIITDNYRHQLKNDVWAEARKSTNYSYVGKQWELRGDYPPYNHGTGNIFGDVGEKTPGFFDAENGDYRLSENSVCLDAGNMAKGNDTDGSRPDLGAFPFNKEKTELSISPLKLDFGSKSRIETITISAYGGKSVKWRMAGTSEAGESFIFEPNEGVIKNGEKVNVHISVDRNQLKDGAYEGHFAVMTNDVNYEGSISFIVNYRSPEIELQKTIVEIEAEINGANPSTERIMVINTGEGNLLWKAEKMYGCDWVQIEKPAGRTRDEIILHFSTSGLGYGEYVETITVYPYNAPFLSVKLPVVLKMKPGKFVREFEAEKSSAPAKSGWTILNNDDAMCIQSTLSSIESPNQNTRLDYEFDVPDGVEFVYVFAEIDVNQSRSNDSFWFMVNDNDPCLWDHVNYQTDGWSRAWVYQKYRDEKHMFVVVPGKNKLNLFTRETGGFINWLVVTNDPNIDIEAYRFGSGK